MPKVKLVDALIDVDNATDLLRHFLPSGAGRRRNWAARAVQLAEPMFS